MPDHACTPDILRGNRIRLRRETVYEGLPNREIGIALACVKESVPHYHNRPATVE